MNAFLADLILIVHFAFVLFVVGGLALIWTGAACDWRWVRNFWFRSSHLAAIVFVVGESLAGMWCPLTVWEDALRGVHAEKSFVARWIHHILFYDFPERVFAVAYVTFAIVVAATWWWIRPESPRKKV
ncbi:MAG: hypothetical protein A3G24_07565 [Betaproteobacteria bacterium RIFCSPLOWO2_12_FULL_62_13]|nr:MAG: hypothetical protein A3G24_07565 [Betaproteobacteria bacterium RIFCSPLOWO2_12_FULL_62_13]